MKAQLQVTGIHFQKCQAQLRLLLYVNIYTYIYVLGASIQYVKMVMSNFTAVCFSCSSFRKAERKQKELVWAKSICGGSCGRTVKEN